MFHSFLVWFGCFREQPKQPGCYTATNIVKCNKQSLSALVQLIWCFPWGIMRSFLLSLRVEPAGRRMMAFFFPFKNQKSIILHVCALFNYIVYASCESCIIYWDTSKKELYLKEKKRKKRRRRKKGASYREREQQRERERVLNKKSN